MKTMKKYFKVILCFLAFAACSFLLAFSPTVSAVYAEAEQAFTAAVNEIKTIKTFYNKKRDIIKFCGLCEALKDLGYYYNENSKNANSDLHPRWRFSV